MKAMLSAAAMTAVALTLSTLFGAGPASAAQPRNGVYPQGGLQPRAQGAAALPAGHFILDGVEYRPAPSNGPHDVFHTVIPVRRVDDAAVASDRKPADLAATCAEMMRKMPKDCEQAR